MIKQETTYCSILQRQNAFWKASGPMQAMKRLPRACTCVWRMVSTSCTPTGKVSEFHLYQRASWRNNFAIAAMLFFAVPWASWNAIAPRSLYLVSCPFYRPIGFLLTMNSLRKYCEVDKVSPSALAVARRHMHRECGFVSTQLMASSSGKLSVSSWLKALVLAPPYLWCLSIRNEEAGLESTTTAVRWRWITWIM